MPIERFILIAILVLCLASFAYIPRRRVRRALLAFLAIQAANWSVPIGLVQTGIVAFPVRGFPAATKIAFLPEFVLCPTIFMWYVILHPDRARFLVKLGHLAFFVSLIVAFIYFCNIYTDLYESQKASAEGYALLAYAVYIPIFLLCHLYISWFFAPGTTSPENNDGTPS